MTPIIISFLFLFSLHNCDGFQERQSIIKYWLDNLRAKQGEVLHNIHFLEGQPISTLSFIMTELCFNAVPYIFFSLLYLNSISTL